MNNDYVRQMESHDRHPSLMFRGLLNISQAHPGAQRATIDDSHHPPKYILDKSMLHVYIPAMNIETRMAWVAGVLEGEAYFGITGKNKNTPVIQVAMTDKDIMEKLCEFFGNSLGEQQRHNWKKLYRVQVCGMRAAAIMMTIYFFMGERRKSNIKNILNIWRTSQSYIKENHFAGGIWNQEDPKRGPRPQFNREKLIADIMNATECSKEEAIRSLEQ